MTCERCSEVHLKCHGHRKTDGRPCGRDPITGGTVCIMHGGKAPQVRAAADRRLAERAAMRKLHEHGVAEIRNPLARFKRLVEDCSALADHFAERVADLAQYRYTSDVGTEQLRSELALYERALDRAGRFLVDWVRLGFEERMVALEEQQFRMMADLLDSVLSDPDWSITQAQRQEGRQVVDRHLSLIAG